MNGSFYSNGQSSVLYSYQTDCSGRHSKPTVGLPEGASSIEQQTTVRLGAEPSADGLHGGGWPAECPVEGAIWRLTAYQGTSPLSVPLLKALVELPSRPLCTN